MKWILVLLFVSLSAHAEDKKGWEVGLSAPTTFSTPDFFESGTSRFSTGVFFKAPVSDHWQIKLADDSLFGSGGKHRFTIGADYNFSDDWSNSFFVGFGVGQGWGTRRSREPNNLGYEDYKYGFGYVEAGKRFSLVRSWGLVYTPQVQISAAPKGPLDIAIMPMNLSLMF